MKKICWATVVVLFATICILFGQSFSEKNQPLPKNLEGETASVFNDDSDVVKNDPTAVPYEESSSEEVEASLDDDGLSDEVDEVGDGFNGAILNDPVILYEESSFERGQPSFEKVLVSTSAASSDEIHGPPSDEIIRGSWQAFAAKLKSNSQGNCALDLPSFWRMFGFLAQTAEGETRESFTNFLGFEWTPAHSAIVREMGGKSNALVVSKYALLPLAKEACKGLGIETEEGRPLTFSDISALNAELEEETGFPSVLQLKGDETVTGFATSIVDAPWTEKFKVDLDREFETSSGKTAKLSFIFGSVAAKETISPVHGWLVLMKEDYSLFLFETTNPADDVLSLKDTFQFKGEWKNVWLHVPEILFEDETDFLSFVDLSKAAEFGMTLEDVTMGELGQKIKVVLNRTGFY